jgi:hypothetical protein
MGNGLAVIGGEIKELRAGGSISAKLPLSCEGSKRNMKRLVLIAAFLAAGWVPAAAADAGIWRKSPVAASHVYRVIPRSPAASLVWAGDACWRGCAMDCGRHLAACLSAAPAEDCIAQNDACDRFCQRECRAYGGPLLPLD